MVISLVIIGLCLLYAVLNVSGVSIIKSEISTHNLVSWRDYLTFLFNYKVITAFLIIFVSAVVIIKALSLERFSYVVPIAHGMNFSITVLVGYILFGDRLSIGSYVGLILVIAGILIMGIYNQ